MPNLFLDPEFQYWLASMFLAFLVAIAVAEILAQRKHRLALQALRTGRDCHPKGGHQ
jgi:dolichyl-phosphate-mannose--protein O-mannosyl transferase